MGFKDVAFLPSQANFSSHFIKILVVVGLSKDMHPVRYLCSYKASLCQLNFIEIISLS